MKPSAPYTMICGASVKSRDRNSTTLVVDVRSPTPRSAAKRSAIPTCSSSFPMGSKWSLSKLDGESSLKEESSGALELREPPSKMRRIYGFMRCLVGFGLGNGQD
ncbi:hypothetical protein RB195_008143 [Necator americanus]|uniref:Uncharacterized protein n=1 Tax=Necator americanus TaxID=51031 RepID=A0ABR1CQK4_NECAM